MGWRANPHLPWHFPPSGPRCTPRHGRLLARLVAQPWLVPAAALSRGAHRGVQSWGCPRTRARGGAARGKAGALGCCGGCRLEAVLLGRGWQGCGGDVGPLTRRPVPRFSALHHAALNGNTELISLLLEAQAAVDIKDNKGESLGPGRGPPHPVSPLRRLRPGAVACPRGSRRARPARPQACGPCTTRLGKARRSP